MTKRERHEQAAFRAAYAQGVMDAMRAAAADLAAPDTDETRNFRRLCQARHDLAKAVMEAALAELPE